MDASDAPAKRKRKRSPSQAGATIHDVAREAGVSTATVSRVLNRNPTVNDELASRVRAAIAKTDYVLNDSGRRLRRQRSETWAVVTPDILNPFFVSVVAAVEASATQFDRSVVLCHTNKTLSREREHIAAVIRQQVAGVVVAPTSPDDFDMTSLRKAGIPVVFVDRAPHGQQVDAVVVENVEAGRVMARHLLSQGFRRPACLLGQAEISPTEDRLRGFREIFSASGIDIPNHLIRRTDLREDSAEVAARSLMGIEDGPDCLWATNGPSTVGAFRAMQALGLTSPHHLGLAGTDDDVWTRMVSPAITVIRQPVVEMGQMAAQLLVERENRPHEPVQQIVLHPTLIPRASTVRVGVHL